ncbi:MAG: PHP domain-containing protein [Candidatus Kapaibacterium sp.]|nr:MAG: PHP domain-containing protein [Candidatus Kapabacteria bacterium]
MDYISTPSLFDMQFLPIFSIRSLPSAPHQDVSRLLQCNTRKSRRLFANISVVCAFFCRIYFIAFFSFSSYFWFVFMQRGTIFADLHSHTTASDGAHTPTMLVQRAFERALKVIAVTDHDTVAGVAEARNAAEARGMGFLSGIEMSASLTDATQREVHILGYNLDEENTALLQYCTHTTKERQRRAERILARLAELGKHLTLEEVRAISGDGVIGRHHIAIAMRNARIVRTVREAFDKYLADDAPAAVAKWTFPAAKAIELIHHAGGVAVLAHPGQVVSAEQLEYLISSGLDGVEVHHPAHDGMLAHYYQYFTDSRQILGSGGSDYHGGSKRDDSNLGRFGLVQSDFECLHSALQERSAQYKNQSQSTYRSGFQAFDTFASFSDAVQHSVADSLVRFKTFFAQQFSS